ESAYLRVARRLPPAPVLVGLRLRLHAAGYRAHRPRQADVRPGHSAGEPGSRTVAAPPLPRRRLASLPPGEPVGPWRARVLPGPHLHARRRSGGVGGPGRTDAPA